jgi:hypothetical protein
MLHCTKQYKICFPASPFFFNYQLKYSTHILSVVKINSFQFVQELFFSAKFEKHNIKQNYEQEINIQVEHTR